MSHACNIVVGASLPCQSGVSFGTSISRPSTFTLIFSIAGGAGLTSVVVAADILIGHRDTENTEQRNFFSARSVALWQKFHFSAHWALIPFLSPAPTFPSRDALHPLRLWRQTHL